MTVSIYTLFTVETAERILQAGLEILQALGVDTTSWETDDPVRALFKFGAQILETRDTESQTFIESGFLSTAAGSWLALHATDVYGVTPSAETYATSTITLANGGGGYYEVEANKLVVKNTASGVTYHSTADMVLASGPGTTTTVAVVADEGGTAGNAGTDEIDDLVSPTLSGVTVTASTVAVGVDAQSDGSVRTECQESLGALGVNGPSDAYNYVVKQESYTGYAEITRAWTVASSSTGTVTVYVAGTSGTVSDDAVTAAQAAVEAWATPNCITPTVVKSVVDATDFAFDVSGTGIPASYEASLETLIATYLAELQIGGLLAVSATQAIAHQLLVTEGVTNPTVTQTAPASDTTLTAGHIATVNSCTVTEV